jgi:hypothetical protein
MVGKSRDTITYSKATLAILGFLMLAVVAYLYFLNMSVVQVVMRSEHVQKQRDLGAELATLEARYIEAQHAVAARIATLNGYDSTNTKVFVSRDQAHLVLSNR